MQHTDALPERLSAADSDPDETREWLEALDGIVRTVGHERARFVLDALRARAARLGIATPAAGGFAYANTIAAADEPPYPGDIALEEKITAIVRWNALAMVVRANAAYGELGGHIASYASAAEIFECGFQHFFRGAPDGRGDLVFFQPHSAPGVYARAYLEGRLSEDQLVHFRQEVGGRGLSSYPHPWLMPDFWQFPTGSMGLGPITAVYAARFMRYLEGRGLATPAGRRVWGVFGDGEMDEPESIAGLTLAAREHLDNLTFIVNCNLQRLDGPVRGNGQIVRELEALFRGAGWNVIKVLWGSQWDELFARDTASVLTRRFATMVDGELQTLGAKDGRYNRERFFQSDPELGELIADLTPEQIATLRRGGHDLRKLYAGLAAAQAHRGAPTVVLALTTKGYGLSSTESRMTAHQEKKLDVAGLRAWRDRFGLQLSDDDLAEMRFYRPPADAPEMRYLRERRASLGGALPARPTSAAAIDIPALDSYARFALDADGKVMSTTVALVRIFNALLKDPTLGPRIVPIVADEARTFGMANMFRQIGIYAPHGQRYEPEDADTLLFYREAQNGQLLEEGITEAGALASWIAAATAYSVHGIAMLPFYIYYSIFGFQRVGDLIWAAADQRSRGFLIGATSGRTTLGGEGLQHQDGSSHVVAATIPNCRAYDPAFAGELAVIVDHGARRMLHGQADEFYYVTVMNENYAQPSLPHDARAGVIAGMYRFARYGDGAASARIRLLGSGAILREVIAAAELLAMDWNIASDVYSVTSFSELARDARDVERHNRLHPLEAPRVSHLNALLAGHAPVVAATDYVRAYPQLIAAYLTAPYTCLGTDGFGRSDTRAALRAFFEVNRHHIVVAALDALRARGECSANDVAAAIARFGIDADAEASWSR